MKAELNGVLKLPRQGENQLSRHQKQRRPIDLGHVIDPVYGKLDILQVGDAGDNQLSFFVKGTEFGPDWREESELAAVHLTESGRKKAGRVG